MHDFGAVQSCPEDRFSGFRSAPRGADCWLLVTQLTSNLVCKFMLANKDTVQQLICKNIAMLAERAEKIGSAVALP